MHCTIGGSSAGLFFLIVKYVSILHDLLFILFGGDYDEEKNWYRILNTQLENSGLQ